MLRRQLQGSLRSLVGLESAAVALIRASSLAENRPTPASPPAGFGRCRRCGHLIRGEGCSCSGRHRQIQFCSAGWPDLQRATPDS